MYTSAKPKILLSSKPNTKPVSERAITRVHEQIFGNNRFHRSNENDNPLPKPLQTSSDIPIFNPIHSFTIYPKMHEANENFGILFRKQNTMHQESDLHGYFAELIQGDVIVSVNGISTTEQSFQEIFSIIQAIDFHQLCLKVQPEDDAIEYSIRSVPYISCQISFENMINNKEFADVIAQNSNIADSYYFCVRNWVQTRQSFAKISCLIKELYASLFSEENIRVTETFKLKENVLFSHREGYSSAIIKEILSANRFRILIESKHQTIEVPIDEINHMNPATFEGVENLVLLRHINEDALVRNLHVRFAASLPYTYCGTACLMAINPMRELNNQYTNAAKRLFYDCQHQLDMPPHVYSIAQLALSRLETVFEARSVSSGDTLGSQQAAVCAIPSQAICLMGRSGSGKSISTEHILEYIVSTNSSSTSMSGQKVRAMMCLLDAFTCSRTLLNTNASRSLRLITIDFSTVTHPDSNTTRLRPTGLQIDVFLLDKFRVTRRPPGEPTFHVFYYLLAGLRNSHRNEFLLDDLTAPNLYMTPLQRSEDKELAKSHWDAICRAADVFGTEFSEQFVQGVCRLLVVIYHLGCAGAAPPTPPTANQVASPSGAKRGFLNFSAAEKAAHLLGTSVETLTKDVFHSPATHDPHQLTEPTSLDLLGCFVANVYAIAVNTLKDLISRAMNSQSLMMRSTSNVNRLNSMARIYLIDPPGWQTPEAGGRVSGGSFEDLLYNYANEGLLQLYQEKQNEFGTSTGLKAVDDIVAFLDAPPSREEMDGSSDFSVAMAAANVAGGGEPGLETICRSHQRNQSDDTNSCMTSTASLSYSERSSLSSFSPCGLLWLLDSAHCSGDLRTYLSLAAHKYQQHKQKFTDRDGRVLRRLHRSGAFSLNHWNTTVIVQYQPTLWFSGCHVSTGPRCVIDLLQRSSRQLLRNMGDAMDEGASASTLSVSSCSGLGEAFISDVKYVMDILRSCTVANDLSIRQQVTQLTGSESDIHWIHCLLPVANAGLCRVVRPPDAQTLKNPRFCVPLVRGQLHGLRLANDIAMHRARMIRMILGSDGINGCEPDDDEETTSVQLHSLENRYNEIEVEEQQTLRRQIPSNATKERNEVKDVDCGLTLTCEEDSIRSHLTYDTTLNVNDSPIVVEASEGDICPQVGSEDVTCDVKIAINSTQPTSSHLEGQQNPLDVTATEKNTSAQMVKVNGTCAVESDAPPSPSSMSSTYNIMFRQRDCEIPWDQILAMQPADRGLIKQLRMQLDEMEEGRETLMRKQRLLQMELEETQQQLSDQQCLRQQTESRYLATQRQNLELASRLEELEDNVEETVRKQRRSVLSSSSCAPNSPSSAPSPDEWKRLVVERDSLRDEVGKLQALLSANDNEQAAAIDLKMIYLKARLQEMEGRLELETSTKNRLTSAVDRLRDQLEEVSRERDRLVASLVKATDNSRSTARSLREEREAKEAVERKLMEEERRRADQSDQMSSCLQEQFRLQQELSRLLLQCKNSQSTQRASHLFDSFSYDNSEAENEEEIEFSSMDR